MAAPRVTINDLPEQTVMVASDLLIVQNGPTTKKMTVSHFTDESIAAVNNHVLDPSAAHQASAIGAVSSGVVLTASNVQGQLSQADNAILLKIDNAGGVSAIMALSQTAYDAIVSPDPTTLYIITGP